MRICGWSSGVCSSDLVAAADQREQRLGRAALVGGVEGADAAGRVQRRERLVGMDAVAVGHHDRTGLVSRSSVRCPRLTAHCRYKGYDFGPGLHRAARQPKLTAIRQRVRRSEEHTSELQSLMRISYAVFCLKTKTIQQ